MKYTPGPLIIKRAQSPDNVGGFDYAIIDSDGRIVGEAFERVGWKDNLSKTYESRPAMDNARLWSAAPDLLEALKMFVQRMAMHGEWDDGCFYYSKKSASELQEPIIDAWAAIAKAEGKAVQSIDVGPQDSI